MKRISSHHIIIILICFITFTFAHQVKAQGRFTGGAMVALGQGKMGNGTDVADRAMSFTPVSLFAGYNFKKFRLGANYEYYIGSQSEDPAAVANQNVSGKGTAMGLRFDYYDGKQSAGLIYRLSDSYTLDQPTKTGTTAVYKSKGGFQLQYYRQIKKRFGFVIDYTTETFDESLPSAVKWDRIALGIVFTNFASSGK